MPLSYRTARFLIFCISAVTIAASRAQDAAPANVDLKNAGSRQPTTLQSAEPNGNVSELSELDQIFKQTSLGKTADEYRLRVEWRRIHNQVVNEQGIIAARENVDLARTDLQKRERLRDYYNLYFQRLSARASSVEMRNALAAFKAAHIALLEQPRVRPSRPVISRDDR